MAKAVLPRYTMEERAQILKSLKKGDELIKIQFGKWEEFWEVSRVTVKNVTKKGNVRLSDGKLLTWLEQEYYDPNDKRIIDFIEVTNIEKQLLNNMEKMLKEDSRMTFGMMDIEEVKIIAEIFEKYRAEYDIILNTKK